MKFIEVYQSGTTRRVIGMGVRVLKIAKNRRGLVANVFEYDLWRRTTEERRAILCPSLGLFCGGRFLVARRAEPVSEDEMARLRDTRGLPDWNYRGPGDDGDPSEPKAVDWGRLDGRLVMVDYASLDIIDRLMGVEYEQDTR